MDCTTFKNSEIDALYGELDDAGTAEMAEHAASCASCSARLERLRGTRGLVLSVAIESVPDNFESRIMAAVDAGMAKRAPAAAAAPAPAAAPPAKAEGGAKIFKFMARPAFAVAATFVLVLGGAAIVMTQSRSMEPRAASVAQNAPMASAGPGAPVPMATEAAESPELATVAATPTVAASAVALLEPDQQAKQLQFGGSPAAPPPAPMAAPVVAAKSAAGAKGDDRAFASAKALYTAGRYSEALPRFEALKATNPEADLYAARCIAKTQGCVAAAPRFDSAAQTNAGTEAGNRATLEGAKCYQANGAIAEARKRYAVAKDEDGVGQEAAMALDALDGKGAGSSGGGHAAPKMARPAPAAPAKPTTTTLK